jgi:hypothetical protein
MRIVIAVIITISLVLGASCSGGGPKLDDDTARTLRAGLTVASGVEITELKMDGQALAITYTQTADEDQAARMERWLNMSAVAISFMDEPSDIVIYPAVDGKPVSRVTIDAGDVAGLLVGDISFDQALSRVEVKTLK